MGNRLLLICLTILLSINLFGQRTVPEGKMKWWKDARFGMFIHWGPYSILGGEWKGRQKYNEFVMLEARIPLKEYAQIAATFNPLKFNAEEWVLAAKNAGMKYVVYTSKHHDGFAMYHSKCSQYNIFDMTPFKRDPLKELEVACRKHGIKLGVYYSLGRDWEDPDVPTNWPTKGGRSNTWDYPDEDAKDINRYMERKVKPQIREILRQYNPDIIWFDTPENTPALQSAALRKMILDYNPDIIINNRIGNGKGDFDILEQKQSDKIRDKSWEACVTMSKNWGYIKRDNAFKSPEKIIHVLTDVVSKGGNFLLNTGPLADGSLRKESLIQMEAIGEWMRMNGEAIYGSRPWIIYGEDSKKEKKQTVISRKGYEDAVFDATKELTQDIRFTTLNGYLYVIARYWEDDIVKVNILSKQTYPIDSIRMLGIDCSVHWEQTDKGLLIHLPESVKNRTIKTYVFKIKK